MKPVSFIHNPAEKPKDQLIAEFVIRKEIFEKLFGELIDSDRELPPQHYLIVGQRGMGKTTLLLRVMYAIQDDEKLNKFLMPLRFSEEQYNIGRLEQLWEEAAHFLGYKNPVYSGLYDEMVTHEKSDDYERICFEVLEKKLKEQNQRAVLLIDNIGDLFDKFSDIQNHRFREILMASSKIQIIGCSSKVLEHTFHYDKPFFEFFMEIKLKPITQKDCLELMKALGDSGGKRNEINAIIEKSPQRIDTLRRITGGVPRTMALLFDIFIDRKNGSAFDDLHLLLDQVSALYKQRMDELKPQQQQIIDALARAWEPISANQILEKSKLFREGIRSNQISSQLKQLMENQVVEMIETKGIKNLYFIRERFFNIWYLMRHGRKNEKEDVLWLIKFLEAWCTVKDIQEMVSYQIEGMKSGTFSQSGAYYKTKAIQSMEGIDNEIKSNLAEETEKFLREKNKPEWADEIIKYEGESFFGLAKSYFKKKDYGKAEQYFLKASELGDSKAMNNLAYLYANVKKDYDKAEQYYLKASELGNSNAMYNLALLYNNAKKDYDKAEQYYLKAFELKDSDAMNNLAYLYEDVRKDYDKAEQYYLKASELGNSNAMHNLALLYKDVKKDYDKAEQYYLKASELGNSKAMHNLALLYEDVKKDYDKAERYYLKASELGDSNAMHNLTLLYVRVKKDLNSALKWAEKLFEIEQYYKEMNYVIRMVNELLHFKQYHFLLKQFQKEKSILMKYAKPHYYVIAYFLKNEMPGEYEKAGSEIKETVDEIIDMLKNTKKNKT